MKPSQRPMRAEDIPECADIVAKHPVVGPRYGPMIDHLAEAWRRLLGSEASFATLLEATDGKGATIWMFGFSLIVRDDFVREMKSDPPFWVGPELTRRVLKGEAPVLTEKEIREGNSRDGLNLVVWEGCAGPGQEANTERARFMMEAFIELHRGYRWKEIISPHPESTDRLRHTLHTGGFLWDRDAGCYTATVRDLDEVVRTPHLVGVTRELEQSRRGNWSASWVGALFDYQAPILGFNRSEQRLLERALAGSTDEQLAETLGTSLATVKKMWVSIYNRVEDRLPVLIPGPLQMDLPTGSRGREKRRGLLAYLRDHAEELRPFSRKLLGETPHSLPTATGR